MYSAVHGAVGAVLAVAGYSVAGDAGLAAVLVAGFASHDVLDRLGEAGYGNLRTTAIWEGVPFAIFALAAWVSGIWWVLASGWVAGNMMDLIDKRIYLAIVMPDRVPMGYAFRCHRRRPDIKLSLLQTKAAAVLVTAAIVPLAAICAA